MKRSLVLLEQVPAGFQPDAEEELFALMPQACQALEERGLPYRTLPELGIEERLRERQETYFQEQIEWFAQLDRMLQERLPQLKSGSSVPPALLYGYKLKTLLDDWFIRGTECAALLEDGVGRVTFYGAKGPYSQLLSLCCAAQGIPYEEHLFPSGPAAANRYRALRPLLYSFRRWSRIARNGKGDGAFLGAGRLTLLFLESNSDLNDLLNSALRNQHRCLVREGPRILDLSKGGKTVFSIPSAHRPETSWDPISEELFGASSPLWDWIRNGWGLPVQTLLAEPLKEWIRAEVAQLLSLAEGFRNLYRREGVEFVLSTALVSNPHAAAVAACDPAGKPQAVLIAHGDGAEVKPSLDLFELAPYQHYFVPDGEFASYFERRRSLYPFPTARVHVGSYRWKNYTQLRHRRGGPPLPVPAGKPVVVVPICQPEMDIRYLNLLGYSETRYYQLQRHLLNVFSEFPEYSFVIKLFPPQSVKTSAIAKAVFRSGAENVYVSSAPFPRWLPWADRVLLDWPSTPLYETALAGVPLHLLLSTRECTARPEALEKFKGLYTPFSTTEEAAQAVRKFLRDASPKPASIQPEGEEILARLVGMSKDLLEAPILKVSR